MDNEESKMEDIGRALAKAIDQAWLETRESTFPEMVNAYRQIEVEYVRHADNHEFFVLETRRRITEAILRQAHSTEQSFRACQDVWNELVGLGFTNLERQCTMTWFYADCCLLNEEPAAGVAVLEPLIVDIERQLEGMTHADTGWQQLHDELARLKQLNDEIKASIRD